uniref:Putative salivary secreted mucin 3 n=1 Tax=Culex tarsalis TaxID=7177 RepID=A0A1Q3EV23_CULTA
MKSFATCLLVVGAVASIAYAYPARSDDSKSDPSNDAEFIVVPLEHQRPSYFNRYPSSFEGFDGVLDTEDFPHPGGQSPVFFPSINPFTWQFSSYLDDIIKRVRDRFAGSWNPFYGGGDFIPSGPGLFPIDIPDVESGADGEAGQTNSTSTVKVIDGHKVIINDTYYTKKTDFGTSVFKVRVIDVQPADGEESDEKSTTTTEKSIETGNRNGGDDDAAKKDSDDEDKKEPTTAETPKRDTELDSSDEEATPVDDSVNTIDDSKTKDIDGEKKDTEVNTEADADSTTTSAPAA